jgi:outer membrane receptor protein involved in Fe transport
MAAPAWSQDVRSGAAAADAQTPGSTSAAGDSTTSVQEIVVNGAQFRGKVTPLALSTDPKSDIASVTALSNEDILRQSLASNVDVFRSIPGVQVSDFGQVGLAQGITVRGWPGANDSSAVGFYLDGVQRNEPSGTGANGYLDINGIIPETLDGITVVKGPFDTRYGGNFALAASAVATTADFLPTSLSASGGSYGHARVLATFGYQDDKLTFYTAIQGVHDDGYQRNSNDDQLSTFSKLGLPLGPGHLTVSLQTYDIRYASPGYIDLANVQSGLISPQSDVDPHDGGAKDEQTLVAHYRQGDKQAGFDLTGYVDNEHRHRFDTFTPYPEAETRDRRVFYGGSAEPHLSFNLFNKIDTEVLAGVSVRHDDIRISTVPSVNGMTIEDPDPADIYGFQRAAIGQTQVSAYANVALKPFPWLKLTGGGRYDYFDYDVQNQSYASSTNSFVSEHLTANTGTFSPKGGIAIQPIREITLYANIGQSLVSPDGGRDIIRSQHLSPATLSSEEIGLALNSPDNRFHVQVSAYDTTFSNEVTFVGLTAINQGQTKRSGYDIESSAIAVRNKRVTARLYGNYSSVVAKLSDGSFVPNVAKWVGSYGAHVDILPLAGSSDLVTVDLGQEFTGPQALDAPETAKSGSYTRVTARVAYEMPERHDLSLWVSAIVFPESRFDEFGFVLAGRTYVTSLPKLRVLGGVSAKF